MDHTVLMIIRINDLSSLKLDSCVVTVIPLQWCSVTKVTLTFTVHYMPLFMMDNKTGKVL